MKTLARFCPLLLFVITPCLANDSPVVGVWTAEMHEKPAIKLTVNEKDGKLSGNIIFYMLMLENGTWQVKGDDPTCLINPRVEGNAFVFEVVHAKHHGSIDPAELEIKTFRMELTGKNQGAFRNALDGKDLILTRKET